MMWWFDSNKTKQNKTPSSKFFANLGFNIEGHGDGVSEMKWASGVFHGGSNHVESNHWAWSSNLTRGML